jgi:ankyrin repeat protein
VYVAASEGHKEVVELFLALGADPDNTPGTPWSGGSGLASLLVQAASGGNLELVQLLLQRGMSLARDWQLVLKVAVRGGHLNLVRLLIDRAHAAVMEQPQQQPQRLTKQQSSVPGSKHSMPGWARLWVAAEAGHMGLMLLLLHSGMDITQQALQSALTRAAGSGQLVVAQLLLQYKADINGGASAFSSEGPLGAALEGKHWAMAEALLMRGAHVGLDALLHALQWWTVPSSVVQLLLQRGVRDTNGRAIFRAAQAGRQDVVELLLNDAQLEGAVCGAAMHADLELLQFLLEPPSRLLPGRANAKVIKQVLNKGLEAAAQGRDFRWTPAAHDPLFRYVSYVAAQQRAAVVAVLLQQGGDPNYRAGRLLLLAAQPKQRPVLEELLQAGANKIDPALEVAAGSGHTSTVSLLLDATRGPVDSTGAALLSAALAGHGDIVGMLMQRSANAVAALHTAAVDNNSTAAATILSFPITRITRALHQELVTMAAKPENAGLLSLVMGVLG